MANVVDLSSRSTFHPDYDALARNRLMATRRSLGLDYAGFAAVLSPLVGWTVAAATVRSWETDSVPPGNVLMAASSTIPDGHYQAFGSEQFIGGVLGLVAPSFSAETLNGYWVTSFTFSSGRAQKRHVDIACISAESDRFMSITNHPPAPRSEGRASPFCNDLEAQLTNRHVVGHWKNSSDARYFGTFQLAVLPGETVMTGYYTGFGSDVEVSTGPWKWVRLDEDSIADADVSATKLRDPSELGARIEDHSPYHPALTLADIEQES
jgi:hypothetical protein